MEAEAWVTYYIMFNGDVEVGNKPLKIWIDGDRKTGENWKNLIDEPNLFVVEWIQNTFPSSSMIRFVIYVQF